jgi:serine protease Do
MVATLSTLAATFPGLAVETSALVEGLRRNVVVVRDGRRGAGSGVIWAEDGVIVTNYHVTPGTGAQVELWDGRSFAATVRLSDPEHDLAILDISATGLPAIRVGDSDRLRVGELVFAVGNPLGLSGAVNTGIITATPRSGAMGQDGRGMVQADVSLAPGNSGGLLATAGGAVVGINSMVREPGLALAVPVNRVTELLGRPAGTHAYLGVTVLETPLPSAWHAASGTPAGLLVTAVEAGSPAAVAGIILGDVLVSLNGRRLDSTDSIAWALTEIGPGSEVRVSIMRGGSVGSLTVQAGSLLARAA